MRKVILTLLLLSFISPAMVMAAGSHNSCATKYPVVLAHGMLATDKMLGFFNYWWGIEGALEDEGAQVFVTRVNCLATTANKALSLKEQILQILAVTGKSKVNIIGHSHGTLYGRYAISNLGLSPKVASYTSLGGAHKGSQLADLLIYGLNDTQKKALESILNWVYGAILGDTNPDALQNGIEVTTRYVINTFNPNTPDTAGVYYQSWAYKITQPLDLLAPAGLIIKAMGGGENDGIVTVESQKWGNFRGIITGLFGVNHLMEVNQLCGITPGFDAKGSYIDFVKDLKNRGY